jgi:hypothetical protein
MKKNFLWMAAAIMTCGLAFTACAVDDNPNPDPTYPFDAEEYWNKTTSVIDFEDDVTPFIGDSRITVGVGTVEGWDSKVATFKNSDRAQNGYSFAHYNFTEKVQKAAISIVTFDMYNAQGSRSIVTIGDALVRTNGVGAGCGKMAYGSKGAIFRIGSDKNNAFICGTNYSQALLCNKWLKVAVKVYNFDRQVEWTVMEGDEIIAQSGITEGEGEEAVFTPGKVDYWQADANEGTQIDLFGCINNSTNTYIDNLTITNAEDPEVKFVDYKIRYVDAEGKDLKEPRIVNGREGTDPVLLATDSADFYLNEAGEVVAAASAATTKKIYVSTNVADVKIAENAEVLMTFRDAEVYGVVLNCMAGNVNLKQFRIEDALFEGDSYYVYPSLFYKNNNDNKYYGTTANAGYNCAQYTFGPDASKRTISGKQYVIGTLSYNVADSLVYFAEAEDLVAAGNVEGSAVAPYTFSNSLFARWSGGWGAQLSENGYLWTEPIASGTYNVFVYGRNDVSATTPAHKLGIRKADGTVEMLDATAPDWGSASTQGLTYTGVTIPDGCSLVVKAEGESWHASIDEITIYTPSAPAE